MIDYFIVINIYTKLLKSALKMDLFSEGHEKKEDISK